MTAGARICPSEKEVASGAVTATMKETRKQAFGSMTLPGALFT
jgi:hypothetical protein